MLQAIQALLAPIRRRLDNIVSRAVVRVVTDNETLQRVQLQILADETREHCERFQEYGFSSHPLDGAEAAVLFVGGLRDHPLIVAVDDRRYRKGGLTAGEVALYTDQGAYLLLKRGPILEVNQPVDLVNSGVYRIAGLQVVGPRQGAITKPTGGGVVDAQARTAINAIIDTLQTHGLTS